MVATVAFTGAIVAAALVVMDGRGLEPTLSTNIQSSKTSFEAGALRESATHPPLLTLMLWVLQYVGIQSANPWVFSLVFLAAGLAAFWGLTRYLLGNVDLAFSVAVLAVANPFYVWTALLRRDASPSMLFVNLLLWSTVALRRRSAASPGPLPAGRWSYRLAP